MSACRKPAALEARNVLADAVHLVNARPGSEKRLRQSLLLREGDAASGRCAERGSAAGDQEKNEVIRLRGARQLHRFGGGIFACLVRNGVPRLDELERFQFLAEPVTRDRYASQRKRSFCQAVMMLSFPGHARRSLAAGNHNDFPFRGSFREVAGQAFCRQRSRDGAIEKSLEEASGFERHNDTRCYDPASAAEPTASLQRLILGLSLSPKSRASTGKARQRA